MLALPIASAAVVASPAADDDTLATDSAALQTRGGLVAPSGVDFVCSGDACAPLAAAVGTVPAYRRVVRSYTKDVHLPAHSLRGTK